MSEPKASIPKFGSFRPKPSLPVQSQLQAGDVASSERSGHKDGRSHHERHRSRKSHSRERRRDKSRERHHSPKRDWHIGKRPSPPPKDEYVEIFIVDRKGDVKNLEYGSIHRYNIPPFHRFGAGSVLGIPSYVRIDRDYGDEKGIVLNNRRNFQSNSREKYVFSKTTKERPRVLKIRPQVMVRDLVGEVDFVPLLSLRGKKGKEDADGESSGSDEAESKYVIRCISFPSGVVLRVLQAKSPLRSYFWINQVCLNIENPHYCNPSKS